MVAHSNSTCPIRRLCYHATLEAKQQVLAKLATAKDVLVDPYGRLWFAAVNIG